VVEAILARLMRLTENEIEYLSRRVIKTLVAERKLELDDEAPVIEGVARAITQEMMEEDRLNEEVREVLVQHTFEMERSNITYNEMFKMVKRKLAKEKGVIL
jgi:hypothetical protein